MKPDAEPSPEAGSAPLWIAFRPLMASHAAEFFSRWDKLGKTLQEDDIHDLRVASRRLREALALFAPILPEQGTAKLVKRLRKVTRMLGEIRNTDEAFLFFSQLAPEETANCGSEVEELLTFLRREREQAHLKLRKELGALDPDPLRKELHAIMEQANLFRHGETPFMQMTFFAGGAVMERAEAVAVLLPLAVQEADGAAQHRLRIAVKKLRYRLEILAPLLRWGYDEFRDGLKEYQDLLGKLHDVDVFAGMVQERLPEGPGREALLSVMARRRSRLYRYFMKQLEKFPLASAGQKIKDAL